MLLGLASVNMDAMSRPDALAAAFAEAGVHRLVFRAPQTPDGPAQTIDAAIAAIADL